MSDLFLRKVVSAHVFEEPVFDIAHLGHVELLTPKPDESLFFFTDVLGMQEVGRRGDSVYLRCWGDYEQYSIKLTSSRQAGVGHTAWRSMSPAALERRAKVIAAAGYGIGWSEGDLGHGKAYQFRIPGGQTAELYFESEVYQPPEHLRPALKNQPQKNTGQGVSPRRLDHVNYLSPDIEADAQFVEQAMKLRMTEQIVLDSGQRPALWYRATNKSYDVVYSHDDTGSRGRLHHIAFAVDTFESIARAADIFLENGTFIEFAPSKHAINQTYFVYVLEPGGNRIEICAGGYMIFAPDWVPITWSQAERAKGQAWGNATIPSFHTYGTPVVEDKH